MHLNWLLRNERNILISNFRLAFLISSHVNVKYPTATNPGRVLVRKLSHINVPIDYSMTISSWRDKLEQAGIPDPDASVRWLSEHLQELIEHGGITITDSGVNGDVFEEEFAKLCQQRLDRKPVQYIIGDWDFHNINLLMKPPVFIPRPETEGLVELVNHHLQSCFDGLKCDVLEICCGSGAISLSLAKQNPMVDCIAVDISPDAVALSNENAKRLNLSCRVKVHQCSAESVDGVIGDRNFDIIVSNPPYISTKDMKKLQPEIMNFEDHVALHGGADGLDIVRHILSAAHVILRPNGTLWLEVDTSHPPMIEEMIKMKYKNKLVYVQTHKDIFMRNRFCQIRKCTEDDGG